jgi:DNA-binding transcriptional regulator YiaG
MTEVEPPQAFAPDRIQEIRERMGLSQAVYARVLNASSDTVKAWEQGKRQPDGMALTLLQVAERHPKVLMERVRVKQLATHGDTEARR